MTTRRKLAPRKRATKGAKRKRRTAKTKTGPLTKTAQIRMCGNSVCPPIAAALVFANFVSAKAEVA